MIIKNIDGSDFQFEPKRLRLGPFENLMLCVEAIQESKKLSETIRNVKQAMAICLDNYDSETTDLDLDPCMVVIAATAQVNRVSVDERKKSE
jgi:hypothetical protein